MSKGKSKVTLETFYQEFKDEFKYIKDKVDSIEAQTKKTNGRVNRHDVDLSLINERYMTCPARVSVEKNILRKNLIAIASLIAALGAWAVIFYPK